MSVARVMTAKMPTVWKKNETASFSGRQYKLEGIADEQVAHNSG